MAVNFPDNPIVNDEFTSGARTWIWDGSVWLLKTKTFSISGLDDVGLTNLANGDALLYNSTSQEWENGAVDVQGAIDTANAYTDSAVLDLTEYIDGYLDPSTGTTTDYIDQQDAATLATANAYADAAIDSVVGLAPETLDTLAELAGAINNDPDFLSNIDALPDQTGQSGNYLTTDGTNASWTPPDVTKTITTQSSSYVLAESDIDTVIEFTNTSQAQVTLPVDDSANIPTGASIEIVNAGSADLEIVPMSTSLPLQAVSSGTGQTLHGAKYLNGRWFAYGYRYMGYSDDNGVTWSAASGVPSTHVFYDIAYDGTNFIAVGTGTSNQFIAAISADGSSWTNISSALSAQGITGQCYGVVYNNGMWSLYAGSGYFYSTDGGSNWTNVASVPTQSYPYCFFYANGLYIAGGSGGNTIAVSSDGLNFTTTTTTLTATTSGTFFNNQWVLSYSNKLSVSSDGINWTSAANMPGSPLKIFGGDSVFYVVGNTGLFASSTNLVNYTTISTGITSRLRGVYSDNNATVVVGDSGTILRTGLLVADVISNSSSLIIPPGNISAKFLKRGSNSWLATVDLSANDIPATTVSETAPAGAEEGDTWFRSSTGQYFVYYDSYWIEVGAGSDPDLSAYYTSAQTDTAISTAINGLIDSAPSTLDTLNELAAALADDADFASTIVNQIGTLESTLQASIDQRKVEINQAVSSDVTLATGYRYFVDTSAARTLTLPLTPALGDEIQLFDSVGTGSTNNVTINNNSEKINGVLDSAIIDIDGFATVFVYTGSTYGWRMI